VGLGEEGVKAFQVREATPADAPGIRALFARVFGKELPEEEWLWKFERNPDGWFGVVAVADGKIIGNYAGCAMQLLVGGAPRLAYTVGDVATDPAARGLGGLHGVYRAMVEAFYEVVGARSVPFCFGFPNARALELSNRIARTRTILPIHERRVPCGAFAAAAPEAAAGDFVDQSFDSLWDAVRGFLREGVVRDRARANWRFHARPTRYYRMVWCAREGTLESWAALSVLGKDALVADFLGRDPEGGDLPRLFAAAAAEAGRLGATTLVFWESPGGAARRLLERLPGERREAGFSLAARIFEEESARLFFERAPLMPAVYDVV
jgi:hypothetical protein